MAGGAKADQFDPEIPDRMFFRIGDVSEITGVEAHVLRFWETEFPTLSPAKTAKGQRQYRRRDVETVLAIKRLLYRDGYTIAGARRALRSGGGRAAANPESAEPRPPPPRAALEEIRTELQAILNLLDG